MSKCVTHYLMARISGSTTIFLNYVHHTFFKNPDVHRFAKPKKSSFYITRFEYLIYLCSPNYESVGANNKWNKPTNMENIQETITDKNYAWSRYRWKNS